MQAGPDGQGRVYRTLTTNVVVIPPLLQGLVCCGRFAVAQIRAWQFCCILRVCIPLHAARWGCGATHLPCFLSCVLHSGWVCFSGCTHTCVLPQFTVRCLYADSCKSSCRCSHSGCVCKTNKLCTVATGVTPLSQHTRICVECDALYATAPTLQQTVEEFLS